VIIPPSFDLFGPHAVTDIRRTSCGCLEVSGRYVYAFSPSEDGSERVNLLVLCTDVVYEWLGKRYQEGDTLPDIRVRGLPITTDIQPIRNELFTDCVFGGGRRLGASDNTVWMRVWAERRDYARRHDKMIRQFRMWV